LAPFSGKKCLFLGFGTAKLIKEVGFHSYMHKDVDLKIIELLEENAKLTSRELGEKLNLPTTTVHNKIKRLEKDGTIRKYVAVIDKTKIGRPISALVYANTNLSGMKMSQDDLCEKIRKMDDVENVRSITGDFDVVMRLSVASTEELNNFIVNRLRKIDGVTKTVTTIILKEFD
jgi:Lrp/AsnC family leucine-responsive transcriptional regulator